MMSDRETWMQLIREEYDPRPNLGLASYPGFEWDDGAGRIADAILADQTLILRRHAEEIERMKAEHARSSERIDAAKVEPVHGGIQARCYIDRSPTGLWFFYSDEWRGMMLCHRDLGTLLSEIPKVGRLLYESMRDWHSKTPYTGEAQLRQMKIYEDFFGDQPDSAAVSGSTEGDPASVSQ